MIINVKTCVKTHTFTLTESALYAVLSVLNLQLKIRKHRQESLSEHWNAISDAGLTIKIIKSGCHVLNQIKSHKKNSNINKVSALCAKKIYIYILATPKSTLLYSPTWFSLCSHTQRVGTLYEVPTLRCATLPSDHSSSRPRFLCHTHCGHTHCDHTHCGHTHCRHTHCDHTHLYAFTRLMGTIRFFEDTSVFPTNRDIAPSLFHRLMGTRTNLTHTLYFPVSLGHRSRLIYVWRHTLLNPRWTFKLLRPRV